jgi:ABC-2 type transport system ATP-binding protein
MLKITNVVKHFKDVKAVDGIDIEIKKGEYVALLGPNGAGKTTLVEMIEGIQKPDAGEILIEQKTWDKHKEELHQIIGLCLQETRFIDKYTVEETFKLFASFYNLDQHRVEEILKAVNLVEKRKTFVVKLSGGQRQRLAIGIAILNNPEILLLDEPTTGLDPTARRDIWNILNKLREQNNTTMILTTHYMEEASYLCDRIIIMDQGKVLAKGTLEELLAEHKKGQVISFETKEPITPKTIPKSESIIKTSISEIGNKGEIIVEDLVGYLPHLLEKIKQENLTLTSLECRKMTLDDLFIAMTGRHLDQ